MGQDLTHMHHRAPLARPRYPALPHRRCRPCSARPFAQSDATREVSDLSRSLAFSSPARLTSMRPEPCPFILSTTERLMRVLSVCNGRNSRNGGNGGNGCAVLSVCAQAARQVDRGNGRNGRNGRNGEAGGSWRDGFGGDVWYSKTTRLAAHTATLRVKLIPRAFLKRSWEASTPANTLGCFPASLEKSGEIFLQCSHCGGA